MLAHKVRRNLPTNAFKGSKYLLLRRGPESSDAVGCKIRSAISVCSQIRRFGCVKGSKMRPHQGYSAKSEDRGDCDDCVREFWRKMFSKDCVHVDVVL